MKSTFFCKRKTQSYSLLIISILSFSSCQFQNSPVAKKELLSISSKLGTETNNSHSDGAKFTWKKNIKQLLTDKYSCTTCHNSSPMDWSNYTQVSSNIKSIIERVNYPASNSKHMPMSTGKSLTKEEVNMLRTWLDDGTPFENVSPQPKPEQPAPKEPNPEEPKPEEPAPQDPQPEQPTPEEPTPVFNAKTIAEENCMTCHASGSLAIPNLNGLTPEYLNKQFFAFKKEDRIDNSYGVMNDLSKEYIGKYNKKEINDIVSYISSLKKCEIEHETDAEEGSINRGKKLFSSKSCKNCHSDDSGYGPDLFGQGTEYLIATLNSFKDGSRKSSMMKNYAKALKTDQDIADVAAYLNGHKRNCNK